MRGRRLEVVPDSERVDQRLVDLSRDTPFVDARRLCTLSQLVDACEPARWASRRPAPPLLVRALIAEHAPEVARAFGAHSRTVEFAAQVQALLNQLRAQAATSRQLARAAQQAPAGLSERGQALAELWRRLDASLEARGLVDPSALISLAAERLRREGLPPRLGDVASITVRFVHDLFPARLQFLEALAHACHRARVGFELAWPASGEAGADVFVLDAVRQVEAKWQELNADAAPDVPEAPLAWLGAAIFTPHAAPRPAPELSLVSTATARDEAREIARRVKRLVSAGTPPEAIAIFFRDLASDTERLVEALADAGVPARARLGVPLPASPVGRLALSVLELVEDEFPADGLATLLESRYVTLLDPEAAPPRRTFAEAGVQDDVIGASGEAGAWLTRLSAHQARLQRTDPERAEKVARLQASVERTLKLVRSIPAEAPAAELLEAFWDVVTKLGLLEAPEGVVTRGAPALLGRELDRALARDQAAVEALGEMLGELKEAFRGSGLGQRVLRRRELGRWLRSAAGDVNLVARGPRTGAVWLLDAREAAGRHFDFVFLGGLVDGRFPGRPTPLPLLSDAERGLLNQQAGAPLFRLSVADGELRLPLRLAEDRLLFHLVLSSARRQVTLSRPRFDDAGRELLGSPFLDAVKHHVAGLDEAVLVRRPLPTLDEVATESELRARAALEILGPMATRQTVADGRRAALAEALAGEAWLEEARALSTAEVERLGFFSDETRAAGAFSGKVEALGPVLERLDFHAARPLSAGELNAWGQCAFRGLGLFLLGLEGAEAAGEEPDSLTAGTFLHDALERLAPALQDEGLWGKPGAELGPRVEQAVRTAAARTRERLPTGHPVLWELHQARSVRMLTRLLREPEAVQPFGPARVEAVELRFGEGSRSPPGLEQVVVRGEREGERDVHLRGRVDRLDVSGSRVGVVDYKTSPRERSVAAEELLVSDFQLPFYAWAMRQLRPGAALQGAWVGIKKAKALLLSDVLEARGGDLSGLLAHDEATRKKLEEEDKPNLPNAVHGLLGRLRRGEFGARPTTCKYCELKAVCRISARQLPEEGPQR
ncbi:MAG: PD-(D/E)XK nuclease family protein [Myxococcota bacterium]